MTVFDQHAFGGGQLDQLNAFIDHGLDFLGRGRHFLTGAPIDDADLALLADQTFGGTGGIHGRIAAANDGHFLSQIRSLAAANRA